MVTLQGLSLALLVVGGAMVLLERIWPGVKGQRVFRKGYRLDLAYWFFTPLATRAATRAAAIAGLIIAALALGLPLERPTFEAMLQGHGPISRQPVWLQAIELIVLLDFLGYWMHRAFHGRQLWAFHEIHHSPEELDWLAAVRVHPVNDLVNRIVPGIFVIALGFAPGVLAGALPFFAIFAILLHANVDWDFGPFRAIIASPRFHRWHHTSAEEARDKNFAGLLPFWDILFGTYYMPKTSPQRFSTDRAVPASLWGQLVWPFRMRAR